MRKIFSLFAVLAMLIFSVLFYVFSASAANFTNGYLTYTVSNGEATIVECDQAISEELVIPATLDGYPVTTIGESAFSECQELPSVSIPYGVISIGNSAFSGCTQLNKVSIPNSVTSIGSHAFMDCFSLTAITIPDSVTIIGSYAFIYCESLTSVRIPGGVSVIERCTFYDCSGLTSLTIEKGVTTIDNSAFAGCSELTSIVIPDGVTTIGINAFSNCTNLEMLMIPNSVTIIGKHAFEDCTNLVSLAISDNVAVIEKNAFYNTGYYNDANNWVDNVLYIGNHLIEARKTLSGKYNIRPSTRTVVAYAFYGCSDLVEITVPDGVRTIGEASFEGCTGLSKMTIPDSTTLFGFGAFKDCTGLIEMSLPFIGETLDGKQNSYLGYIFGAYSCTSNAENVPISLKKVVITNATIIGDSAFYNCSDINTIVIADNVTTIDTGAFMSCDGLTSIVLGNDVSSIGERAFGGCTSLTSIEIPGSVTQIEEDAFSDCTGLKKVYINDLLAWCGIQFAGEHSNPLYYTKTLYFKDEEIKDLVIPEGVTTICSYAFAYCSGLTSVNVPESVTTIERFAFYRCDNLTEMTLPFVGYTKSGNYNTHFGYIFGASSYSSNNEYVPDSLEKVVITTATTINKYAFKDCADLVSITLPDDIIDIGIHIFDGCTSLRVIDVETDSGNYFSHEGVLFKKEPLTLICYPLGKVGKYIVPDSTMVIGRAAFYNCNNLTEITISTSVTTIDEYAFCGCEGLTSVIVPDSVTAIGVCAFNGCSGLVEMTLPFVGNTADGEENGCFGDVFRDQYVFGNVAPKSLKKVTVTNAKTIGPYAFRDCSGLTSITISDSVTSIGEGAFYGCTGLTEITVPFVGNDVDGTESTELSYFFGDRNVAPDSLKTVAITKATTIGDAAFYGCAGLTEIRLPESVITIGDWAFYGCSGLAEIRVPDGVKTIGGSAFSDCTALISITFGKCSPTIGQLVFNNCDALENIYVEDLIAWCDVNFEVWDSNPLYYAENLYINGVLTTDLVIPDGIDTINAYAFYGCDGLKSVSIPESVKSIEVSAFSDCPNLAQISLQGDLTYLAASAFNNTAFYNNADNWENEVLYMEQYLIAANDEIYGNYTVKSGTRLIANNAFYNGCYGISNNLTSIVLPTTVVYIGENAFAHCAGLCHVWYAGTPAQKEQISFGAEDNKLLLRSVTWHYESCTVDRSHTYDNDCDATCADCSYIREGVGHDYGSENAIAIENHQHRIPCSNGCGIDQIEDCVLGDWVHEERGGISVHLRSCVCGREEEETCEFSKYVVPEGVLYHQITCATCGYVEKTEQCSFEKLVHIEETSSHQVVCDTCGRGGEVEACTMRALGVDLPNLGQVGEVFAHCIDGCGGTDRTKEILSGDISGDGEITISDAVLVLRVLSGNLGVTVVDTGAANVYTADSYTEGLGVNTADAIAILQYIMDR